MKFPTKDGSLLYNYKKFSSSVLQVVVDSESRYIFIGVGAYGNQSNCGIFFDSTL